MRFAVGCLVVVAVLALLAWGALLVLFGVRAFTTPHFWSTFQWSQFQWENMVQHQAVRGLWAVAFGGAAWFGRWILTMAVSLLACVLIPRRVERMASYTLTSPWSAVGIGLLAGIAASTLVALLAITIIGIPLALLTAGILALTQAIGFAAIGLVVGKRIRTALGDAEPDRLLVDVLFGLTLLLAVGLVPIVAWPVTLVARSAGFGAAVMTRLGTSEH